MEKSKKNKLLERTRKNIINKKLDINNQNDYINL